MQTLTSEGNARFESKKRLGRVLRESHRLERVCKVGVGEHTLLARLEVGVGEFGGTRDERILCVSERVSGVFEL